MSLLRQVKRGLRALFHVDEANRDTTDEITHFLEEVAATYRQRGLSPEAARRAARRDVGDVGIVREQVRSSGWEHVVETFFTDLRYAVRRLRTEPGFTVATVGTLALGLGGATAIFSAVNAVLLQPLPYPTPDRIVMIWEVTRDAPRNFGTFGMFRTWESSAASFDALAVLRPWQVTLLGTERPERLLAQRVSANYFNVFGVHPVLGTGFRSSDDRSSAPNVVILSDGIWQRRFGADSTIVGRSVTLDDNSYTVIGVMPRAFDDVLAPLAELWVPLRYDMSQDRAWGHHLRTVARLRSGVPPLQAESELNTLGAAVLSDLRPASYGSEVTFRITRLRDDLTSGIKPALFAIFGAVVLLLAVACVNVANLILGHAVRRRGELALRSALGAGVGRLVRQLLTESLLLAAIGGTVGWAVAFVAVRGIAGLIPPELPRVDAISLDGPVIWFGIGVTPLVGIVCGLMPMLISLRGANLQVVLGDSFRRTVGGNRRARAALVVGEVALTLVLLVSSGLLFRSLQHLFAVDSGFDSSGLLTMQVRLAGSRFDTDSAADMFFEQALRAVRREPGVQSAAFTTLRARRRGRRRTR